LMSRLNIIAFPMSIREFPLPARVLALDVSSDGDWIAAACNDGVVRLWQRTKLKAVPERQLRLSSSVLCVRFAPDGRALAAGWPARAVWLVSLVGDAEPLRILAHRTAVTCLVFDRDGRTIISGGEDGDIHF